ncbi:MAG: NAD-dependent epimerase/dehydratase family protein [Ignavibacteria bacterium]|jgi:carbamoyl-phosphate synthase large subunit
MKSFKNKKVFVSGGNGVIGRELVRILASYGANVFTGDLKPKGDELPCNILYRQGDLNYIEKYEIENFSPEIFIHLAATFERSTESYEFWDENFWHNVRLSNYLMSIMKDLKSLKKVIFASSYLIYDPKLYNFVLPQKLPVSLKENDNIYPRNLIGMAKLSHEIELRFLNEFKSKQFKTVTARIYRGYGLNSRDVISRWVRSLLNNETITVYKKEGIFDYIFSRDTAEGLLRLALSNKAEGVINLGTGKARKVEDIVDILMKHFPKMKIKYEDSNILYEASQADIAKLIKLINWSPKISLEKGIDSIIKYEKSKKKVKAENFGNILITSISKKIPLIDAVKKSARKFHPDIKVLGVDIKKDCIGKYFVDKFLKIDEVTKMKDDELLLLLKENDVRYIIPTRDGELIFWSNMRNKLLKKGINVFVSDTKSIEICLDKFLFYKYSKSKKIPSIQTSLNISDIKSDYYVVKERFGAGAKEIGIKLSREKAGSHSQKLSFPIFQPYIDGKEYSFDTYVNFNGKIKGIVIRERNLVVNGESQITTTIQDKKIEKELTKIVNRLNLRCHIVGQMIIDSKGKINIIEINPRFGGASTVSIAGGLDSFYWFLLESNDVNIDKYPFISLSKKIKQIRFPQDYIKLEK